MMYKLLPFFLIILISCSQNAVQNKPRQKKNFHKTTEDLFSDIEQNETVYSLDHQKAAERYRKLREKNWNKYLKKRPVRKFQKQYKSRPKKTYSAEKIQEFEIQSQQIMSYYCLKNNYENNSSTCKSLTEKALNKCRSRYRVQWSNAIISCLKSRL